MDSWSLIRGDCLWEGVKHAGLTVAIVNETGDKLSNMCLLVVYTFIRSLYFVQFARGLSVTFLSSPITFGRFTDLRGLQYLVSSKLDLIEVRR